MNIIICITTRSTYPIVMPKDMHTHLEPICYHFGTNWAGWMTLRTLQQNILVVFKIMLIIENNKLYIHQLPHVLDIPQHYLFAYHSTCKCVPEY